MLNQHVALSAGNVYLSGVTGNVQSALSGVGSLYIDTSNGMRLA